MKHYIDLDKNMIGGTCKARDFQAQIAYIKATIEGDTK